MEFEKYIDDLKELNNQVLYTSIPYKLAEFMGLKKGDRVQIMIKKVSGD